MAETFPGSAYQLAASSGWAGGVSAVALVLRGLYSAVGCAISRLTARHVFRALLLIHDTIEDLLFIH